ncbi:MAG: SH3 domain-containing protein [Spirochaetales bacterium]|nr:SH3 domain-containing protein [Spirochaetales bacterium]
MKRIFFLITLLSLSALFLFSEEQISQDKGYVNRNFKVYVKTMVPYSRDLAVELPREEDESLILAAEPYLRPYNALTDNQGEIIYEDMTEIVLTFRARTGDIYPCRGLRLYRQKFEMIIPEFPVIVHSWDERNLDYPLQLYWSPVKEKAYAGEIISLVLNVRYTESLEFPEHITMKKPAGGNLDQVDLPGSIESYDIRGKTVYAYPLESWYFSSGESGRLAIPGGTVKILGLERKIPPLSLDVLPLPGELQKSGAVGDFSLMTKISQTQAEQGEIVTFTVRIEGTGNFHYLSFPEVVVEGFELINTDEKEELNHTEAGYSGYRERIYRYQAGDEAKGQISCAPYAWFNPNTEKLHTFAGEQYPISIILQGRGEKKKLTLLSASRLEWLIFKEAFHSPLRWLLLAPGLLYFLMALFSLNEKQKSQFVLLIALPLLLSMSAGGERRKQADMAQQLYEEGRIDESLVLFEELYHRENRIAYLYNMAVLEYYRGHLVESEILFRKGLLALPGDQIFVKGLKEMERLADLEDQYVVDWKISSWSLNLLLILLIDIFLFVLALYLKNKRLASLLLLASLFFLSLGVGAGIITFDWMSTRPQGIVEAEGAQLRRIPEENALEWLQLSGGTSVRIITEKKGYYFIRTGYGLEGWIGADHIELIEVL